MTGSDLTADLIAEEERANAAPPTVGMRVGSPEPVGAARRARSDGPAVGFSVRVTPRRWRRPRVSLTRRSAAVHAGPAAIELAFAAR